jgi:hypothetical protein
MPHTTNPHSGSHANHFVTTTKSSLRQLTKDPIYRYYNCNIQAPRIRANEIYTEKISFGTYAESDVNLESGKFDLIGTVFDIFPADFARSNACGELTLYAVNNDLSISHVMMIVATKSGGTISTANVVAYQSVGNCIKTSGTTTIIPTAVPSGSTGIRATFPFEVYLKWIWRGA